MSNLPYKICKDLEEDYKKIPHLKELLNDKKRSE